MHGPLCVKVSLLFVRWLFWSHLKQLLSLKHKDDPYTASNVYSTDIATGYNLNSTASRQQVELILSKVSQAQLDSTDPVTCVCYLDLDMMC